jgi:hypothetical protein
MAYTGKGFELAQHTKDMSATKLSNVGRVKEAVAGSMLKHPWKWGGAVVGLGLAKFALAGWAIGKVTKKKKEQPKKYMAG